MAQLGSKIDDADGYAKLEDLSRQHLKIPLRKAEREIGFVNINRNDATGYLSQQAELPIHGKPNEQNSKISNVLRHDYLRKSLVDRIERKTLVKNYRLNQLRKSHERASRPTKTQILRTETNTRRNNLNRNDSASSVLNKEREHASLERLLAYGGGNTNSKSIMKVGMSERELRSMSG